MAGCHRLRLRSGGVYRVLHEGIAIGHRVAAESARFTDSAQSLGVGGVGHSAQLECPPAGVARRANVQRNDQRGRGLAAPQSVRGRRSNQRNRSRCTRSCRQGLGKALLDTAREFSDVVQITDSAGRRLQLSHAHRLRHAKLTRLAETRAAHPRPANRCSAAPQTPERPLLSCRPSPET